MSYRIIVGRSPGDRELFGDNATVYLGKLYVKMGETTSLSNEVYMDVARTHVVMIAGKRGSGKSTTMGVMAEEMSKLPADVKENISVLFFDTMGIFWTMKYPNLRQEELLGKWGLTPEKFDMTLLTPLGFHQAYLDAGIPSDAPFTLTISDLNASDWCEVFGEKPTSSMGIALERAISTISERKKVYSLHDLVASVRQDQKTPRDVQDALESRFLAAERWGLFSERGTPLEEIMKPGGVTVIDISSYTNVSGNWSIKGLVIGMVCRKLMEERMKARKQEEMESIQQEKSYFYDEQQREKPMVWVMIDEAHEFLPREEKTPATDALVQLLREGRQPGISLVLATQQPGEIHQDVLTQSDIVISHRLTAQSDIEALNKMMQSYLIADLQTYLNNLPKDKGASVILDDNSERIYPVGIHPKRSWHGGEAPSALKIKKELFSEV